MIKYLVEFCNKIIWLKQQIFLLDRSNYLIGFAKLSWFNKIFVGSNIFWLFSQNIYWFDKIIWLKEANILYLFNEILNRNDHYWVKIIKCLLLYLQENNLIQSIKFLLKYLIGPTKFRLFNNIYVSLTKYLIDLTKFFWLDL